MYNLSPANTNYLLEVSLEDLHRENRNWFSEIEFWRIELSFYQKLLEKLSPRLTSVEEKKKIDHFQNLLIYFRGELLDQFEHDTREQERSLDDMMQDKTSFDEQLYREVHKKLKNEINSFDLDFKEYRKELYNFAEKYI